jgi:hypothetical protein
MSSAAAITAKVIFFLSSALFVLADNSKNSQDDVDEDAKEAEPGFGMSIGGG